ncbi:MAG TPA: PEP-CTERM sorting domain-containing protein [Tepidisphaeraceae bacterium]|jgi:hypothetical protein|nr:PEP-CTERM sorting domain-containing protein [Tepidisphaeraceae bacterium]
MSSSFVSRAAAALIAAIVVPSVANAAVISVNFQRSGDTPLTATQTAGVVPAANWNDAVVSSAVTPSLAAGTVKDDAGNALASTTIGWSSTSVYRIFTATATTGDGQLMKAYLDNNGAATITIANLPATFTDAGYKVIVYADSDKTDGDRVGQYRILSGTSGSTQLGEAKYLRDSANFTANGTSANYVESTVTVNPVPADNTTEALAIGNYVTLGSDAAPLTASTFRIEAFAARFNGSVNGFQIVSVTAVPEPTSLALAAVGACGLLARRRRSSNGATC